MEDLPVTGTLATGNWVSFPGLQNQKGHAQGLGQDAVQPEGKS